MGIRGKYGIAGLLLACMLLLPSVARSQNTTEKWGISYSAMGGYVWAHKGKVDNLKAHVYGGMVGFRYKTANRMQWQRIFNSPTWGVNVLYLYYGRPNILGSVYAILPYMEFPLYKKPRWELACNIGTGLGYITRPFDLYENTVNQTIGSHINGNLSLHGTINYYINPSTELILKGGLTHFSNGNFRMPNLGVNTPDIQIGLAHYFGKREVTKAHPDDFDTLRNEYRISSAIAYKRTDYIFPHNILVGIIQFKYLRSLTIKSKLGGGLDIFYDRGNYYIESKTGSASANTLANALETGIKLSHELHGKHLGLITDAGVYLYNKNYVKGRFYQRVGLLCKVAPGISIFTALKVHFARADYFEWGINYRINQK